MNQSGFYFIQTCLEEAQVLQQPSISTAELKHAGEACDSAADIRCDDSAEWADNGHPKV